MTLKALAQYIQDDKLKVEAESDFYEIIVESEFCRDWRNRLIAHIDYELSVDRLNAEPLKPATRHKLKLVIEKTDKLYNKVSHEYLGSTTEWSMLSSNQGAGSLLYRIEDGLRLDQDVHKRKPNGDWTTDNSNSKV